MRINGIRDYNSNNRNNNYNQNFGHKIIIDIGASNKKGSMKLLALKDNGEKLFKQKGFVNDTIKGFDNGQDFINKISKIVKDAQDKILSMADNKETKLFGKDKLLTGLAIFVPGTTFGKKIAFMPNLRDKENNALSNVDFTDYETSLQKGQNAEGIKATKDMKMLVTKDLGGCGLALAKLLNDNGDLHEGDYIMGVMTGGGFGSVDIKVKNSNVEIETSESSNYITGNFESYNYMLKMFDKLLESDNPKEMIKELKADNNEKLEQEISVLGKLGKQGVSVKSHIKTYFKELGKPELGQIALKVGDARIVEDNFMVLNRETDKEIIEEIRQHKEFVEIPSDKPDKINFKLDEAAFQDGELKSARTLAVNHYANAVSLITINKINDCVNKVILAGPFAHGVNRYIKENSADFAGAKDLPELIMQKIQRNIDEKHADLPSSKRLLDWYKLDIICDEKLNFDDNTYAGNVLLNKKTNFVQNRGSWFSIPLKDLSKAK